VGEAQRPGKLRRASLVAHSSEKHPSPRPPRRFAPGRERVYGSEPVRRFARRILLGRRSGPSLRVARLRRPDLRQSPAEARGYVWTAFPVHPTNLCGYAMSRARPSEGPSPPGLLKRPAQAFVNRKWEYESRMSLAQLVRQNSPSPSDPYLLAANFAFAYMVFQGPSCACLTTLGDIAAFSGAIANLGRFAANNAFPVTYVGYARCQRTGDRLHCTRSRRRIASCPVLSNRVPHSQGRENIFSVPAIVRTTNASGPTPCATGRVTRHAVVLPPW
jgi:hypothetical protein